MGHHDAQDGFEGFAENSTEFMEQIEKLNEVWYVFVALALLMALFAFFVHRNLTHHASIKANFGNQTKAAKTEYNQNKFDIINDSREQTDMYQELAEERK